MTEGPSIDLQALCDGIDVRCTTIDAKDYGAIVDAIKTEVATPGLGVIVAQAPCALLVREKSARCSWTTSAATSAACASPSAVRPSSPRRTRCSITETCTGCGLCVEVCKRKALTLEPSQVAGGVDEQPAQRRCRAGRREAPLRAVTTVCLVGVGGQGILLAASLLARRPPPTASMVKASEIHGMAQRGGSVVSTVRYGEKVYSPVSKHADFVLATELLEGHRGLRLLGAGGTLVCAVSTVIPPGSVLRREEQYPADLAAEAAARGVRLVAVDAEALAREAGTVKAVNVALLGAASTVFPFSETSWQTAIERAVPAKILAVNERAFALGRDAAAGQAARHT